MKKYISLVLGFVLVGLVLVVNILPAGAQPEFQLTAFLTPTPGPDGRVLYVVQSGDTLFRIAAVAGIELSELRQLNNLGPEDDVVVPGQVMILGFGGPANTPTPEPGVGVTQPVFSPTPEEQGTGAICVLLYNDVDGDGVRQETEVSIGGGQVSVTERTGLFSETASTIEDEITLDGLDLTCFEDLPVGEYNVSMASPEEYNNTTVMSVSVEIFPGDTSFLNFGAQVASQINFGGSTGGDETEGRSPFLGIVGITLLLVGIGLGIYSMRMRTS